VADQAAGMTGAGFISVLSAADDVSEFDCGDAARNAWLRARGVASQASDDARTYVARDSGGAVCGFYAITTGGILRGGLPGALRRNAPDPVSCVVLAQLGVAKAVQGRGIGRELVLHAMGQGAKVAEIAGCRLLVVHPATQELVAYYGKFGFVEVETVPVAVMAMSLQRVRGILGAVGRVGGVK